MLPSSTRQIHVYGRKGRTRVVQDARPIDENTEVATPPRAAAPSASSTKSLFTGVDLHSWRAWVHSPRQAFAHQVATPIKKWATGDESHVVPESPTLAARAPLQALHTDGEASDELTQALADLSLTDTTDLLRRVHQTDPKAFAAQVDDLVGDQTVRKIGEASYSEVYQYTTPDHVVRVIKVIPLEHGPSVRGAPAVSPMASVDREVAMTGALGTLSEPWGAHFVQLVSAHVVRGAYPARLLQAWDAFKEEHGDHNENARPSVFPVTQMYALLVMQHAGAELESMHLYTWKERAAVFFQVACALAHAEQEVQFEHRDLHMSNVLVRRESSASVASPPARPLPPMDTLWAQYGPQATQWHATIIDYSLSRMCLDNTVMAYEFDDEALFTGQGDTQYDVYRTMRGLVASDWRTHTPLTNVLWLQFLAQRLLLADAPADDAPADEEAAYGLLTHAEQLAHDAVEHGRRHAPTRRLSTRSKRRSIQRAHDAWKVLPDAGTPRVESAWALVAAVGMHVEAAHAVL